MEQFIPTDKRKKVVIVGWVIIYFIVAYINKPAGWGADELYINYIPLRDFLAVCAEVINEELSWRLLRPWIWQTLYGIVPGALLPTISSWCRPYGRLLLIASGISVVFNILRFSFHLGFFDLTDVVLNLIGVSIGYTGYAFSVNK